MRLVEEEVEPAVEPGGGGGRDGGDQGDGEGDRQRGERYRVDVAAYGRDEQGGQQDGRRGQDGVLDEVDGALGDPGALGGRGLEVVPEPAGGEGVTEGHALAGAGEAGGELEVAGDQEDHAGRGQAGRGPGAQDPGVVGVRAAQGGADGGGVGDGGADGRAEAEEVAGLGQEAPQRGQDVRGGGGGERGSVHGGVSRGGGWMRSRVVRRRAGGVAPVLRHRRRAVRHRRRAVRLRRRRRRVPWRPWR